MRFTLLTTDVDRVIIDTIDRGLAVLGENAKQVFWIYLEKNFQITQKDVPQRLDEFQETLQQIFGVGSKALDLIFVNYLREATGKSFQNCSGFVKCALSLYD